MDINELTYQINGAVFEVNRIFGAGFLEKVRRGGDRGQKSEVRSRRSEVGGRRSEVGGRRSGKDREWMIRMNRMSSCGTDETLGG